MSKKSIGSRTLKAGAALLAVGAGVAAINAKNKNGTEKYRRKNTSSTEILSVVNMIRTARVYITQMVIMKHLQDQKSQRALMLSQHIL